DFGTGYSCLAYFKDIPADELKIDRSFVQGMVSDTASADIATLIIDLAHRFGLSVVAEGVEDIETFKLLRHRDCDVVQGRFSARAMRTGACATWLQARSPARGSARRGRRGTGILGLWTPPRHSPDPSSSRSP